MGRHHHLVDYPARIGTHAIIPGGSIMKTNTAGWDYQRTPGLAPYNGTCPICSGPCYTSHVSPSGTIHTCPRCGFISADASAVIADAKAIVEERARLLAEE